MTRAAGKTRLPSLADRFPWMQSGLPMDRLLAGPTSSRYPAWLLVVVLLAAGWVAPPALGAVVVIANRSRQEVPFTVQSRGDEPRKYVLASGDLVPVPVARPVQIIYKSDGNPRGFQLDPNTVCYFLETRLGGVDMRQVGLGTGMIPPLDPKLSTMAVSAATMTGVGKIPVRLCIDDDMRLTEAVWKPRLIERLNKASDIFEKHCRMRFEIVAFGRWDSDDATTDFSHSMHEFEQEATPPPGGIVIGFTSQYNDQRGVTRLGGTRAALHPFVLIREWPQHVNEPERLEVLVHELGHYLGATHSPESDSVMRPQLGDRQARRAKFRIGFDPVNTLAMNLVADELRTRPVTHLSELNRGTKQQLRAVYHDLGKALPQDPASQIFLRLLGELYLAPAQRLMKPVSPQPSGS